MIKRVLSRIIRKNKKVEPFLVVNQEINEFYNLNKEPSEDKECLLKYKNIHNFDNINEKHFVDMPAAKPNVIFPLPKVGVTNRKHKIKIKDIFDQQKIIEVEADIKIFFDLPPDQRGLHMSRIEKAMQQFQELGLNLKHYATNLLKYAAELQNRNSGKIEIEFYYEKLVNKNSSGRPAHELLKVIFQAELMGSNNLIYKLGLSVPFMNACPCPQRWAIRDFYHKLKRLNFDDKEIYRLASFINFGTHTNLGEATVIIENSQDNITYVDLYSILDESVLITRELLSGKDEFEFIKEALIKEQFCEDAAREIVKNIVKNLYNKLDPKSFIEILVEVNESIHFHNLKVEIKDSFGNIIKNLKINA